jgi:hypothetical protein
MKGKRWLQTRAAALSILATAMLAATALSTAATGSTRHAATIRLRARLDAGQVAPRQDVKVPNATGLFTATLAANKLSWTLTYRGLSGPAVGAHIHIAKPGAAHWEPVIGLCGFLADHPVSCRSGVRGTSTIHAGTLYQISASQVLKAILSGGAYVNVHTSKNYNWGEIRGQIAVVR